MLLPSAAVAAARRGRVAALGWLLRELGAGQVAAAAAARQAGGGAGACAPAAGASGRGGLHGGSEGEGEVEEADSDGRWLRWLTRCAAAAGHVGALRLLAEGHGVRIDLEELTEAVWEAWKGRVAGAR